ncbi:AlpA family transcriptional regulator [Caulobacter sp. BP25]|uniref:helix-turn-helix transcriptional regulator n=1 Tax=Caulobacter sp. BP25 TaxID=2048900 RepID=UPI00191BA695|nr:helix-turn-helix domain-containing protein [Caulobacter sp. BP25]
MTRKTMANLLDHPRALPGDAIEKAALAAAMAPLLTPAQVADMLTVSERTLERWRMTGEGPEYVALSRKVVRYDAVALATFVEARRRINTAA